jgi:hypothetical protein
MLKALIARSVTTTTVVAEPICIACDPFGLAAVREEQHEREDGPGGEEEHDQEREGDDPKRSVNPVAELGLTPAAPDSTGYPVLGSGARGRALTSAVDVDALVPGSHTSLARIG